MTYKVIVVSLYIENFQLGNPKPISNDTMDFNAKPNTRRTKSFMTALQ